MTDVIDLSSGSDEEPPAKKYHHSQLSLTPPVIVDVSDDEQIKLTQISPAAETLQNDSKKFAVQMKNKIHDMMRKPDNTTGLSFKIKVHTDPKSSQDTSDLTIKQDNADPETAETADNSNNLLQVLREEPVETDIAQNNADNKELESVFEASITSYFSRATTSHHTPSSRLPDELNTFLNLCSENIVHKTIHKKVRSVRTAARLASDYVKTQEFRDALESFQDMAFGDASTMSSSFVKLYKLLVEHADPPDENGHVVDAKTARRMEQLDDLYDKLEKVQSKVAQYAIADVDFDEEESSAFMKYDKYMAKAKEILDAIAKLQEHSPHSGLQYFSRLDFSGSKYQAFNVALNKKYRNREKDAFPAFYDVNRVLRRCAELNNLDIREPDLKAEIESCFKSLGKLIKRRRQKDLECIHSAYLESHRDPARDDRELERRLKENQKMRKRVEDVLSMYSEMQDTGVEPELSADSEDSAHKSDDESSA